MDPTLKTLKASLEAIREMAMKALNLIEQSQEQRSMRWKCKACRYYKAFYDACSIGNRWQMSTM
jgi:lipopolysaccharide biosynthesis regulator YciM